MTDVDPGEVRVRVQELVGELGAIARLEPLTGGLLNWVWRARGTKRNAIVKIAPPFVATAPELDLPSERIHFEARALELFRAGGPLASLVGTVRPPRLYAFESEMEMLVEEDFGRGPDFAALPEQAGALGEFVAQLHRVSAGNPDLAERFRNDSVQKTRKAVQYDAVAESLGACRIGVGDEAGAVAAELGARLTRPGECLIMGDLWPRSVLPRDECIGLIDWEFVHWGIPAQDIGHFGAHLWMYDRTSDGDEYRRAWDAFSSSWPQLTQDDATRIHFGCEIVARSVGAFSDSYLFADDRVAGMRAATVAAHLIVGDYDVESVWDA